MRLGPRLITGVLPVLAAFTLLLPSEAWPGHIRLELVQQTRSVLPRDQGQLRDAIQAAGLSFNFLSSEVYDQQQRTRVVTASIARGPYEDVSATLFVCDDSAACDQLMAEFHLSPEFAALRDGDAVLMLADWNAPPSRADEFLTRIIRAHW